jgi:hypothetical protein
MNCLILTNFYGEQEFIISVNLQITLSRVRSECSLANFHHSDPPTRD